MVFAYSELAQLLAYRFLRPHRVLGHHRGSVAVLALGGVVLYIDK